MWGDWGTLRLVICQTAWGQFLHRWIQPLLALLSIWKEKVSPSPPWVITLLSLFSCKTMKLCVHRHTHTHTTPLFPWESFPPFLFALLTSLILCIVPTSLRALQKVCSLPFNQLQLVYFTPYRWHCRVSGDAMAASAFPWLEIVLFQDSVANHCRSFVLSAAGTRHTQENNYFTSLPPPSPPACLPSLTISITSLLATSSFPPCDSSP